METTSKDEVCRFIEEFKDPHEEGGVRWACTFVAPDEPSVEVVEAQAYMCPLRIRLDRECTYSEFGGPFPYE
jgi:hypothetical protein